MPAHQAVSISMASRLTARQRDRFAAVYRESFAAPLRVPVSELLHGGQRDYCCAALADRPDGSDGHLVGIAVLRLIPGDWAFLRYFAVAATRRSNGIGRQFFAQLGQELPGAGWPTRIVWEVEHPDEPAVDADERATRQRRVAFWRACGAQTLGVRDYTLPDFTGTGFTERMLLMAAVPAGASLPAGERLRELVLGVYTGRYLLAADDPLVVAALDSVPS
jgi:GNAT superfamily N-acetyltransferase